MSNNPKISIIIPNYNHAAYLKRRIESILKQSYQNFEIIFLDDASEDNSRDILLRYAHQPQFRKVIFNQVNSGSVFRQWRKGLAEARGELVWIAESDDYSDIHMLRRLMEPMEKFSGVGLAYCNSWVVNEKNELLYPVTKWLADLDGYRWEKSFIHDGHEECRWLLLKNTIPNASAVLFRRKLYEEIGGVDCSFEVGGDLMLWAKMLLRTKVAYTHERLNYFRMRSASVRILKKEVVLHEALKVNRVILKELKITEKESNRMLIIKRRMLRDFFLRGDFSYFMYIVIVRDLMKLVFGFRQKLFLLIQLVNQLFKDGWQKANLRSSSSHKYN